MGEILRIALIAVVAIIVVKLVASKVPALNFLANV